MKRAIEKLLIEVRGGETERMKDLGSRRGPLSWMGILVQKVGYRDLCCASVAGTKDEVPNPLFLVPA